MSGIRRNGTGDTDDKDGPVVASCTQEQACEDDILAEMPPAAASAAGIEMPAGHHRRRVAGVRGRH
ncbi:hypothetical protein [Streptomyces collinus]|uniref:hypothetical protein n=1 Tax=Streptomyces collinus TaxID=42684 RepID=UPI0037CE08CD